VTSIGPFNPQVRILNAAAHQNLNAVVDPNENNATSRDMIPILKKWGRFTNQELNIAANSDINCYTNAYGDEIEFMVCARL
jgi:hypothetical protein